MNNYILARRIDERCWYAYSQRPEGLWERMDEPGLSQYHTYEFAEYRNIELGRKTTLREDIYDD